MERGGSHMKSLRLGAWVALTIVVLSGCTPSVSYDPHAPQSYFYEQTRAVSLTLFGMSFMLNESVKYRQEILSVSEGSIEMRFTPLDYRLATTSGEGVQNIVGSALLPQEGDTPEVRLMREMQNKSVRVRAGRNGELLTISLDQPVPALQRHPDGSDTPEQRLARVFITQHLMLTQAVLPIDAAREGESYKPSGVIMDLQNDEFGALMKVDSISPQGLATLRIDSEVVAALFNKAGGMVELPRNLEGQLTFKGDGSGAFVFDMKRQCVQSGNVNLKAEAKPSRPGVPAARVGLRLSLSIREIPAP